MESLELILQEQDLILEEFILDFRQALHPPNAAAIKDETWGRCRINLDINLDEFNPDTLLMQLPRLREKWERFNAGRARENKARQMIADNRSDLPLNLENYSLADH